MLLLSGFSGELFLLHECTDVLYADLIDPI